MTGPERRYARSQQAGVSALRVIAAEQAGVRPTWRDRWRLARELRALTRVCACTCNRKSHEHFRPGTDCGRCGKAACRAFRPARRSHSPWRVLSAMPG